MSEYLWKEGYKTGFAAGYAEGFSAAKSNVGTKHINYNDPLDRNNVFTISDPGPVKDGMSYEEIYGSVVYQQKKKRKP